MRILYVEDNEVNQALVARVCRAKSHEITFQTEGEGALELLAGDPAIDLVLLDIELAGPMSGLDVIQTLRARNDKRPVVAVTAYAMMGDRERILAAGCDQYLPKPLVVPDLLALFEEYEAKVSSEPASASPAPAPSTPTPPAPAPSSSSSSSSSPSSPTAPAAPAQTSTGNGSATAQQPAQQPAPQPASASPNGTGSTPDTSSPESPVATVNASADTASPASTESAAHPVDEDDNE